MQKPTEKPLKVQIMPRICSSIRGPRAWHPLRSPGSISSCLDRCYHAYMSNHIRINVPLEKLQGQCCDSTSAMNNSKCEVAKRISDLEPWTVYTHCYRYTINLTPSDMFKQSKLMKDPLETTRDLFKLLHNTMASLNGWRRLCLQDTLLVSGYSIRLDGQFMQSLSTAS